jgi:flagellar biosynthesis/type III secretory pathway protein FliH
MPSSANVVRLSRPLRRAAFHSGDIERAALVEQMEEARQTAYQKGFADASDFLNQQVAEQRAEVIQLIEQTFKSLEEQRHELVRQIGAVLPGIATEIARRVLCGLDPDPVRVQRTVDEVLGELAPGTRDIEVALPAADLALLGRYDENYQDRYPGLRFVADPTLAVGDCKVRSSFGLVDATIATKLETLARSLQ